MKQMFAITKNVKEFMGAIEIVKTAEPGHRLALAFGPPGTGKTQSVHKLCIDNDYPYVRAKHHMTTKGLLKTIAHELSIPNDGSADVIYDNIVSQLKVMDTILFVDEVDYLANKDKVLTLVDLHDESNCPIVLVGMQGAKTKLQRYPHLMDRCSAVIEFHDFNLEDIKALGKQLCEVKLDETANEYIFKKGRGRFRRTKVLFSRAERSAKLNSIRTISGQNMEAMERKRSQ